MTTDQTDEAPDGPNPWARPPEDGEAPRAADGTPGQTPVAPTEPVSLPARRAPEQDETWSGRAAEPPPVPEVEPPPARRPEPDRMAQPFPPPAPTTVPAAAAWAAPTTVPAAAEPAAAPWKEPGPRRSAWRGWSTRNQIFAAVAAVAVLIWLGATGFYFYERSLRTVDLLGLDAPADDPFGPTLVLDGSVAPTARFDARINRTPLGDLDGLYLDTTGAASCNRAALDSRLHSDPAVATAWGTPLGVAAAAAPGYLAALTPVRVRADTRVTAYGYADGAAKAHPAVLQAGTAVLVDDRGMPRVRCADSGPLTGPQAVADPYYGGADWAGFDPAAMVEVRPAPAAVREFGLVDPAGQAPFRRPSGSNGDHDVAQLPATGRFETAYLLSGPQRFCQGLQNCALSQQVRLLAQFSGCPATCMVTDPNFMTDPVMLTKDGDAWRGSGNLPPGHGLRCNDQPTPSLFQVSFTPTKSAVIDGVWQATEVAADFQMQAGSSMGCVAATLGWSMTGPAG